LTHRDFLPPLDFSSAIVFLPVFHFHRQGDKRAGPFSCKQAVAAQPVFVPCFASSVPDLISVEQWERLSSSVVELLLTGLKDSTELQDHTLPQSVSFLAVQISLLIPQFD
jgi:hypothetical protein